ncbi:MAG: Ig-like domain-containing protein [Gemmatimonas sp.]|uniref:Ig-like domain-containing protein n=1 Tax=Gemmatimonas sp. TaxID=1962908 RepID=UPI00391FB4DB|nr:Ig-like domain-containing protein [Gemmatimonadota bacterium]
MTLRVGQATVLQRTGLRMPRSFAWVSENAAVASVTSTGVVTARAPGQTVITLSGFGISETYRITVLPAPTILTMTIAPKVGAPLVPGQSRQFNTAFTWSDSVTRTGSVTYSTPGGTISNAGLFTAGQVIGTFAVVASCACGLSDTAMVTVAAPQLTALTISPKAVTVTGGATQQFGVAATWTTGATTPPPVTYTAPDGGSVSPAGLFTAPTANGAYRVVVAHTGGTLRDTATVTVGATVPTLTRLTIAPKTASLGLSQTQQFTASAMWSNGSTTLPPVSYSVIGGGGTVTSSGLYAAPAAPGSYRVVVAHTEGTLRDTATVTVGSSNVTLTSLTISPKTVSVITGRQFNKFYVSAAWSNGTNTVPPLTYSVIGPRGHVASDGVFTAPTIPGTYRVVAAQTGGSRADTAVVTVTGVAESPTLAAFTPNRPNGLALITDTYFGNMQLWANLNEDGLAYSGDGRNAKDPTAPFGPDVFETFYPGNDAGNGTGGGLFMGPNGQQWRRMYFSLMAWVPTNYSTHSNGEKFFYPVVITPGQPIQSSYVEWRPIGDDTPNGPRFGFNLITQKSNFPTERHSPPPSTAARVTKGRWTRIEVYCVMNSVGRKDGILKAWIDGQVAADFTDVRFSGATTESVFENIRFAGTRGGGASTTLTPPEGQIRRYSRLSFFASEN